MKTGILAFHCAHNYGAILQCYALQETLKEMGHNVKVIDYQPHYLTRIYKVFSIRMLLSKNPLTMVEKWGREILIHKRRVKKYRAFVNFICHRLELSEEKGSLESYDSIIIGSDQVWNKEITQGFDPYYFADFPFEKGGRIYIAYAASMGNPNLNERDIDYLKMTLANFDAISVREEPLKIALQPLTPKQITTTLDPTLLADEKNWHNLAKKPAIQQKYVYLYHLAGNKKTKKDAKKIAESIARTIGGVIIDFDIMNVGNSCPTYSPEEFLGWIKYASCVVTTSFHGTAFSVIFRRDFYCLKMGTGLDVRAESLLDSLELHERMIPQESTPIYSKIDYTDATLRLNNLREKSRTFLSSALKRGHSTD